jgi:cation:H+ antiporter
VEPGLMQYGEPMIWLQLTLCAAVILYSGGLLSRYAELIAEKSGLSKSLVGLVLLAVITSLSQLVSSLSCVVVHHLPDMAVSALLGSSMFNMMLIGLLDFISKKKPVSHMVHSGHVLSAAFGIALTGIVVVDILFGSHLPVITLLHSMDPITVLIVPLYLVAMRLTFLFEKSRLANYGGEESSSHVTASKTSWFKLALVFAGSAAGIIGASYFLPELAEKIGQQTGWSQSFMGTSFIAVATCLPEFSVAISAARRGSFDIAVASLLGSNLCYMVILAITDFCYLQEPLLRHVSPINALPGLSAMVSSAIVVIGLTYKADKKLLIAGDALALILIYGVTAMLLLTGH